MSFTPNDIPPSTLQTMFGMHTDSAAKEALHIALEELDGIGDPFDKMAFILYVILPSITKMQEDELQEYGNALEDLSKYVNLLAEAKDLFNKIGKSEGIETTTLSQNFLEVLDRIYNTIREDSLNGNCPLSEKLSSHILESITSIQEAPKKMVEKSSNPNRYFDSLFNEYQSANEGLTSSNRLRETLNNFMIMETSLTSQSSATKSLIEYESSQYELTISFIKNSFKNTLHQITTPIRQST